jgi:hypothetical protein
MKEIGKIGKIKSEKNKGETRGYFRPCATVVRELNPLVADKFLFEFLDENWSDGSLVYVKHRVKRIF